MQRQEGISPCVYLCFIPKSFHICPWPIFVFQSPRRPGIGSREGREERRAKREEKRGCSLSCPHFFSSLPANWTQKVSSSFSSSFHFSSYSYSSILSPSPLVSLAAKATASKDLPSLFALLPHFLSPLLLPLPRFAGSS